MHVTKYENAPGYEAPGHHLMAMSRIQGQNAGPSDSVWMGISKIEPGGGTTLSASSAEKFYVLLAGELRISNGKTEAVLGMWDSCRIEPGEPRQLSNSTDHAAVVLLVMQMPPAANDPPTAFD